MKAAALLSGGKDSFLAALIGSEMGMDLVSAVTYIPVQDSEMFHVPNIKNAGLVSSLLDLETIYYDEREFESSFGDLKRSGIECVISGAIASDYQKTKIEKYCTNEGLLSFSPLWRIDPVIVLNEIIFRGIEAIIISVSAEGLNEKFLGRRFDNELIADLMKVHEKYGINLAGEGGEYESFVVGLKGGERIRIISQKTEWSGSTGYLDVECGLDGS